MKKRILRYLKHFFGTLLIGGSLFLIIALGFQNNHIRYGNNKLAYNFHQDGPYIFDQGDTTFSVNYILGSEDTGFSMDTKIVNRKEKVSVECYYPLDSSKFTIELLPDFRIPPSTYKDDGKILAISDIESNFQTFRNFLIQNKIIDKNLNWTFGNGHLVLVGDFIDRSYFTTQVLWSIYKLEQEAVKHGGMVHYILGNHEIMNMQGNHKYAKYKYNLMASVLGKKQYELYDTLSHIGRWMNSKNVVENINGQLFVHGGLAPELTSLDLTIEEINAFARVNYYQPYYPKKSAPKKERLLLSSKTAPYWYRGYFKDGINQQAIEESLLKFGGETVVVGHTIQAKVNRSFQGKVIGIDVQHPKDYYKYFPKPNAEGLLIQGNRYFRVLHDGTLIEL